MAVLLRGKQLPPILLAITLAVSCGKRGDPTPPVPIIPQAVSDLTATQQGTTVVVSWSYPSLTTAGRSLKTIERILLYRYLEPLPAALAGKDPRTLGEVAAGVPDEVALFTQVRPLTPQQFMKLKETLATIEKGELAEMTEETRILFEDHPPLRTADQRPNRVTYGVVTEAQARSEISNLAIVIPLDVPRAPRELTATIAPEAVTLKWEPPEVTLTGEAGPSLVGYNIYRFDSAAPPTDLGSPVNPAPVNETTFHDTPSYGTHRYAVTAVRSTGPPLLQSVTSNTVAVEYADRIAPPVTTNLAALPEEDAIRLIWDLVESPDLAGYRIYREWDDKRLLMTKTPITEPFFRDDQLAPNIAYSYFVMTVDQLGNESAPAIVRDVVIRR